MENKKINPIPIALSLSISQDFKNGMKGIYFPLGLIGEGFPDN
jgi:hypothetical protein